MNGQSRRVVLVPGGMHGSWCFDLLIPELEAVGIDATAVDLPIEDPDAGTEAYVDAIVQGAAADRGPLTLVGHSMGGLVLPVAAERLPVEHLVYLCALLPQPGRNVMDQYAAEPDMTGESQASFVIDDLGRVTVPDADAKRVFYHDCDDDIASWAVARLRPQAGRMGSEPCPLEAMPELPTSYVMCTEDRALPPAWSRRAVPERLGITPIEIPGSHSPFLSRPKHLATLIADVIGSEAP